MIPKIIHFVYIRNNEDLPLLFKKLNNTWKDKFPGWEYMLWKDDSSRDFIKRNFPEFLKKYNSYSKDVQRADAIRYLLLKTMGGLYVDNDFECLQNFEFLLENIDFLAGKEPHYHADKHDVEYIIGNALMASAPNTPFINYLCDELINHSAIEANNGIDIIHSTGPFMLTNTYDNFPQKERISIMEPEVLYPISKFETENVYKGYISEDTRMRIDNAYAIHYALGTWEGQ